MCFRMLVAKLKGIPSPRIMDKLKLSCDVIYYVLISKFVHDTSLQVTTTNPCSFTFCNLKLFLLPKKVATNYLCY